MRHAQCVWLSYMQLRAIRIYGPCTITHTDHKDEPIIATVSDMRPVLLVPFRDDDAYLAL